ncbi:hypothetical protein ACWC2H_33180 [Streptomyces sp. 900105755]
MTGSVRDRVGRTRRRVPVLPYAHHRRALGGRVPQPSRSRRSTHASSISYTAAERPAPSSLPVMARA